MIRSQPDKSFTRNQPFLYLLWSTTLCFSPLALPLHIIHEFVQPHPLPAWSLGSPLVYNLTSCKVTGSDTCSFLITYQLVGVVRFVSYHCLRVCFVSVSTWGILFGAFFFVCLFSPFLIMAICKVVNQINLLDCMFSLSHISSSINVTDQVLGLLIASFIICWLGLCLCMFLFLASSFSYYSSFFTDKILEQIDLKKEPLFFRASLQNIHSCLI